MCFPRDLFKHTHVWICYSWACFYFIPCSSGWAGRRVEKFFLAPCCVTHPILPPTHQGGINGSCYTLQATDNSVGIVAKTYACPFLRDWSSTWAFHDPRPVNKWMHRKGNLISKRILSSQKSIMNYKKLLSHSSFLFFTYTNLSI